MSDKKSSSYLDRLSPYIFFGSMSSNVCSSKDKDWYCTISRYFSVFMMFFTVILILLLIKDFIKLLFK